MALLHFDGFDLGDTNLRYGVSGQSTQSSTRFTSGLATNGTGPFGKSFTASQEVWMGMAVNTPSSLDTNIRPYWTFSGDTAATAHVVVGMKSSAIEARLGSIGGTLLQSFSASYSSATWYYVEIYVKIADSGGRVTVKVDGVTTVDYTGDTKNGGTNASCDRIAYAGNGVGSYLDDWYILDSSGSSPYNTFLGDVRVVTLAPTAAGNTTGMTASTGSNWQTVDERPYSATDYNQGASGTKDTYTMSDLPSGVNTVHAVQVVNIAKKTDAGALSLRSIVRSSSTDYQGTSTSLGTSDGVVSHMWTQNPATSTAWTSTTVNAIEAGAEVV